MIKLLPHFTAAYRFQREEPLYLLSAAIGGRSRHRLLSFWNSEETVQNICRKLQNFLRRDSVASEPHLHFPQQLEFSLRGEANLRPHCCWKQAQVNGVPPRCTALERFAQRPTGSSFTLADRLVTSFVVVTVPTPNGRTNAIRDI